MDEDTKTRTIAEANEADRVLASPEIKKALANMREAYVDGLQNTNIGDQKRLDKLHLMLVLLKEFEGHLRKTVSTGKLVAFDVEQDKRKFLGDIWPRHSNR